MVQAWKIGGIGLKMKPEVLLFQNFLYKQNLPLY